MAWTIEAYDGLQRLWQGSLPKQFETEEVVEVLRLLAARHLSEDEIVAAARGKGDHLNVWHNHERHTITTAAVRPFYVATKGHSGS